jgi:hypothetical protein
MERDYKAMLRDGTIKINRWSFRRNPFGEIIFGNENQHIWSIVKIIINDRGPMLARNIGEIIGEEFTCGAGGLPSKLALYEDDGNAQGIYQAHLGELLTEMYGQFDRINFTERQRCHVSGKSRVLYCDKEALIRQIREKSSKSREIIISVRGENFLK